MTIDPRSRLAFALDVSTKQEADKLVNLLTEHVGTFKIGLELFTACGPDIIKLVRSIGPAKIFLDLKMCDIPETVARAVSAAAAHGVDYLTVHASGGRQMLQMASANAGNVKLLAITMLTSLTQEDVTRDLGVSDRDLREHAGYLAGMAHGAGVPGIVCSPHEARMVRAALPNAFIVTPGIRPAGTNANDQARAATPAAAIKAGADLLVVGRPIRDAQDGPVAAARRIVQEIDMALTEQGGEQ